MMVAYASQRITTEDENGLNQDLQNMLQGCNRRWGKK